MTRSETEFRASDEVECRPAHGEFADWRSGDRRTIDRAVLELLIGAAAFVVIVMTASAIIG